MRSDAYERTARWYDPATARLLAATRRRIAGLCRENGWRRVLDIGCGTGMQALALHDAGLRVTGLDASAAMLAVARRRLPPELALVRADSLAAFAGRSFDAALLSLVLHETDSDPALLLRDALRVSPVCIVLEWRMPERNLDLPGQLLTHAIERLAGGRHYARFRDYAAAGWLRGLAARAGVLIRSEEPVAARTLTLAVLSGA